MLDREKAIKKFEAYEPYALNLPSITMVSGDYLDALELLKEQEVLLKRAYELIADMEIDFCCDDLMCDDGWCDEHCTTNGTTPECIERWLRKQISEGR